MVGLVGVIAATLLVVLASACSSGRQRVSQESAVTPLRRVLPNGVRVIVESYHASDVVALQLWVLVGSRDESPTQLGLAHCLEHMLFRGTTTRPAGVINREVEGAGGRVNAGTALDYTYYHMLVPAGHAISGIETLADVGVNATLDGAQLEREKRVMLEELRLGQDAPAQLVPRELYGTLFAGHPYGRPIIGGAEIIGALRREQLLGFYRSFYAPESFVLVVVGAIEPDTILEAAARTFGRLPRAGFSRLPVAPVATAPRRLQLEWPGKQAYLGVAWLAPRIDHADTPVVDLLTSVLGQHGSSRLRRALRDRLALVNAVSASYAALEGAGIVSVIAQLDPVNVERTRTEIIAVARQLRRDGVTEDELHRAVTAAEAYREFRMETAEGRAFMWGHAEAIWRIEEELAYMDRLRSVTREQVRAAAQRYLEPERMAQVVLAPGARR